VPGVRAAGAAGPFVVIASLLCLAPWMPSNTLARPVPAIALHRLNDTSSHPPSLLSGTGLYRDPAARPLILTDSIHAYAINVPSWSDGAQKQRFISVPYGKPAIPTDSSGYGFPDGTVFIENLALDTVEGDTSSRILIETRFLTVATFGDYPYYSGLSYRWRRDQTDADLVSGETGENARLPVRTAGGPRTVTWRFPSQSECNRCHVPESRGAPGFVTPQLSRPSPENPALNQLQDLADKGVLSFNPIRGKPSLFRWRAWNDSAASPEARARSYFAANCSHCHGNTYNNHAAVSFDYFDSTQVYAYSFGGNYQGYLDRPRDGDTLTPRFIYPGRPDKSYILKRLLSLGTPEEANGDQMPPLGTYRVDSNGLRQLRDWVCSLGSPATPASSCSLPEVAPPASAIFMPGSGNGHERRNPEPGRRTRASASAPPAFLSGSEPFDANGRRLPLPSQP
jgi:cytochrome c553